jgi:hypothetical protein
MASDKQNILMINKVENYESTQVYFFCGFMSEYNSQYKRCDAIPDDAEGNKQYSIWSENQNRDILVTCKNIGQYGKNSIEFLKLDILCRDRTIKITMP